MKKIIFIRHPETLKNISNQWNGDTEQQISEKGFLQLKNVIEKLKEFKIDYVFSSPLSRAQILAKNIAEINNINVITDIRLKERSFGELELQPCIRSQKDLLSSWDLNTDLNLKVEKIQDMYFDRIKPFIEEILKTHKNQSIAIVSHSWVGRLLKFYFSEEKDVGLIKVTPKNCEIIDLYYF